MSAKYLYLASRSARRQQLLRQIGVEFSCRAADVDESSLDGEEAAVYVERLAVEKVQDVARSAGQGDAVVLAADTAVVLDGRIFGKPANRDDAREMLRALSGKEHRVFTAVAVSADGKTATGMRVREVTLRPIGKALSE